MRPRAWQRLECLDALQRSVRRLLPQSSPGHGNGVATWPEFDLLDEELSIGEKR